MKCLFLVSYDGTQFFGWQRQGDLRTVQRTLEEAAERVFGVHTGMTASGRTDAGVHALGQVVQTEAETAIPARKLRECFNRLLPSDVKILASAEAPAGFDCTRSARRKTYRYSAYYAESELPLCSRYAARLTERPDISRMREAAKLLLGRHDFAAFRAAGYTSKTSERELFEAEVSEREIPSGTLYEISVTGDGFLYRMVRILAGELFAVGCGKEEDFSRAFAYGKRTAPARTMPPQGLTLMSVDYGMTLF